MKKLIKVKDNYYKNLRDACEDNGINYNTVKARKFDFTYRDIRFKKVVIDQTIINKDGSVGYKVNGKLIKLK